MAGARKTLFNAGFTDFADERLGEDAGFGGTGILVSRELSFLAFIVILAGKIIKKNAKEVAPAGFRPGKPVQCPFPMKYGALLCEHP
ncbi:MAG: hypothetical protein KGO48_07040 [Alphaproteobacteria bacterium]|nr:hypothetical protein [Alphaproteobacteria bacterium]